MDNTFHLHPITSLEDDLLLPWLDLYETSFPQNERIPVSGIVRGIRALSKPGRAVREYFALINGTGEFLGMAQWGINPAECVVYLGYFAVVPNLRGQGIGGRFYRLLLDRLASYPEDLMMFDVERPDAQPEGAAREHAQARIRFYQRLGAGLVSGLTMCWGSPPIHECMMVHPLRPLAQDDMLRRLRVIIESFGGWLVADPPGAEPGLEFGAMKK